jgi:hypothetical protein
MLTVPFQEMIKSHPRYCHNPEATFLLYHLTFEGGDTFSTREEIQGKKNTFNFSKPVASQSLNKEINTREGMGNG